MEADSVKSTYPVIRLGPDLSFSISSRAPNQRSSWCIHVAMSVHKRMVQHLFSGTDRSTIRAAVPTPTAVKLKKWHTRHWSIECKLYTSGSRTRPVFAEKFWWILSCGSNHTTNLQWVNQLDQIEFDSNSSLMITRSILRPALHGRVNWTDALSLYKDRSNFIWIVFLRIPNACRTSFHVHCRNVRFKSVHSQGAHCKIFPSAFSWQSCLLVHF